MDRNMTEVAFMLNLSKNGHGLLGQNGFFDLFKISFDKKKEEIELKENKKCKSPHQLFFK